MSSSRNSRPAFCSRLKAASVFGVLEPSNSTCNRNSVEEHSKQTGIWALD